MAEKVFSELKRTQTPISLTEEMVAAVLRYATDYLEDAKYYKAQGKLETSLTSVAYCEGILDALRLIGAVKFEWPTNQERKVVLASGVFDLLHLGHVRFLEEAKRAGGENAKLIVIIATRQHRRED